jgi:hypothetical protein
LGQLDELVVVPVGVIVARKMIPDRVMVEARAKAKALEGKPVNRKAAVVVVAVWLLIVALVLVLAVRAFGCTEAQRS